MGELPGGNVTFVFTDIEGSTRLLQRLGTEFENLLERHHALIREAVGAFGGSEIKSAGDGLFLAFADPDDAVQACVQAQRKLGAENWPGEVQLQVRMGIHTGMANPVGRDYVALAVNQAARISSTAHGGQIVVGEETVRLLGGKTMQGVIFSTLGRYRLKDFDEPVEIFEVHHADLRSSFPAIRAQPAATHNLPLQRTTFVGRKVDLVAVAESLAAGPLVTIVGPGGAGKTRLAFEVASRITETFSDGVRAVRFSSIDDPSLVPSAAASVLGIREQSDRTLVDIIMDVLGDKRLLLVFDNCEHIPDAIGALCDSILDRCKDVRILATSRVPLGLRGEQTYSLTPLPIPDERDSSTTATQNEAVQLFVDRARLADASFVLNATNLEPVRLVCRAVDGIPLALELAAARLRVMTIHQVAARLGDALDVLTMGNRTDEPRQRTVRALIDWSHKLLPENERILFRRLSAFRESFALDAAEAICADETLPRPEILPALSSLVDQSLLVLATDEGEPRYRLLTLIRAFADERLRDADEASTMASRHHAWFLSLLEDLNEDVQLRIVRTDLDNFRSAAALQTIDVDAGLALATRLAPSLRSLGHGSEARSILLAPLARENATPATRVAAWNALVDIELSQGRVDAAQAAIDNAEQLLPELSEDDRVGVMAKFLLHLGRLYHMQGRLDEAETTLRACVAADRVTGGAGAWGLNDLGIVMVIRGRHAEALALFEEVLACARTRPELSGWIPRAMGNMAEAARRSGDISRALDLDYGASRVCASKGDMEGLAHHLLGLGLALMGAGNSEDGVRVTAAGENLLKSTGGVLFGDDAEIIERDLNTTRPTLGEERFHEAWLEGKHMTPSAALDLVRMSLEAFAADAKRS